MARIRVLALVLLAVLAGAPAFIAPGAPASASVAAPCGTLVGTTPRISHVIWIWEENHDYSQVIGSSSAPYLTALGKKCGVASNYRSLSHPSAPNYVGATSGLPLQDLPKKDCTTSCHTTAASLFGQTTWRAYEESMPKNCDEYDNGLYVARHNPPTYFTLLKNCATDDVPYTRLAADLAAGSLPAFTFITPNLNDDMHNGTVKEGDSWLAAQLPKILDSAAYTSGDTAIFITWDEGSGGGSLKGVDCITSSSPSCHIPTLVISPYTVPGTMDSARLSHYSLLRTTEEILGLPLLGQAASAISMRAAFGLG